MIRVFHVVAIGALLASAAYAYTIKYETLYQTSELTKLKAQIHKERESIAVLQAEWQHLNRPDRLQALAERHTNLQPMKVDQLARFSDIPQRQPRGDTLAAKLEALGLTQDAAPTGSLPRAQGPITPRPAQTAQPRSVTVAPRAASANLQRTPPRPAQAQARPASPNAQLIRPPAARPTTTASVSQRPGAPLSLNQSPRLQPPRPIPSPPRER